MTIVYNGKGIAEGRATATEVSRGDRTLAKTIFVFSKLQKNKKRNGFLRVFSKNFLRFPSTPSFGNTMLYAVLFIRYVCKYAGEVREIYSFFRDGKKREGKCSFCFFEWKALGKKQNVHFPLRWAFSFIFFGHIGRMEVSDGRM